MARQRMTNIALYEEIRLLLARMEGKVDSVLQVVGGMSYMKASEVRTQHQGFQIPPTGQGPLYPPPIGRTLTEEEKAANLQKAKDASDRIKEQMELGISAILAKRAEAGVPNDGNAVTPQDIKDLDEMTI